MTTRSEIKKVGNDLYLEDPGVRLRLPSTYFTINNNKLYYLENEQGKLKTGYFVLIDDGATTTHYHILAYADQSGEILKMNACHQELEIILTKKSMVSMVKKIKIESPHSNEYYKVVVVK